LGDINLTADSNSNGTGRSTLSTATGGALTAANDLTLTGNIDFSTITSSGNTTLNNATLSVDALDTSAWGSISLTGTNNAVTAGAGDITFGNANDDGSNANLTLTATGAVSIDNVHLGQGDLIVVSNSDVSGAETISVQDSSGDALTLNNDAALSGTINYRTIDSTDALAFSNSTTTLDSFDNTLFAAVSFSGSQNTLNIDNGNLILDTPMISTGSDLTLNVGSGSHQLNNLDVGAGDIAIGAVSGSSNQEVTAEGTWSYANLNVADIDTFINNAQLNSAEDTNIQTSDDIVLSDGSTINADEILLDAGDDVTVTGITVQSDQIPSVIIRAGGDVIDGGNINDDIDVFWVDGVDIEAGGNIADLDFVYGFSADISDAGTEIASISDESILTIIDDSESDSPLDSEKSSVGSLPKSRVDMFVPECSANAKGCRKKNAVRKFLSSLLIGGALPE
jgi:hypothetical protein